MSRKLEVACMYPCSDKLEVVTESPEIDVARKTVMEFLLVNHPLDCPICDKAGECRLQDYTYQYREGLSRFGEDKVVKDTKDLGPTVRIWGSRCISCTRCVRFCEEIVGTGELSLVNRGDHSMADTHPDVPLDNPMSLNVVDICPVGALIDKSFLFQARVWFTERVESTCAGCSRGCGVTATTYQGEVKRLQPRFNPMVNGHWMCDAGRLNLGYIKSDKRITAWKGTLGDLSTGVRAAGPGKLGILVSTAATLEEMHLVRSLAAATNAKVGFLTKDEGTRWVSKSGFAIETDKTPNRRGAEHLFGAVAGHRAVTDAIGRGEVTHLLVINAIPSLSWPAEVVDAAKKVGWLAVSDVLDGPLVAGAQVVVPAACWAEKDGTIMNRDGRIQRVRALLTAPGTATAEATWLQELLLALGGRKAVISSEGVFKEAFPGLDYGKVGSLGTGLPGRESPGAAPDVHVGSK